MMLEKIRKTTACFFGLTDEEFVLILEATKKNLLPFLLMAARMLFIVGFIGCVITYPLCGIFIGILGYYIMQLENKVDILEKKVDSIEHYYRKR